MIVFENVKIVNFYSAKLQLFFEKCKCFAKKVSGKTNFVQNLVLPDTFLKITPQAYMHSGLNFLIYSFTHFLIYSFSL